MNKFKKLKNFSVIFFVTLLLIANFNGISAFAQSNTIDITRISGNTRYQTSVAISKKGWTASNTVIIATGNDFPDALSASALAKSKGAPILLTDKDSMDSSVINEIKRLKATNAILVGGTGVISTKVDNQLKGIGLTTTRIAGINRYETAKKVGDILGANNGIIVATGDNFPDALSIAPIAGIKSMPILLSSKAQLDSNVTAFIKGKNIPVSYIVGGEGVLSDNIAKSVPKSKRLAGNNRYETNININSQFSSSLNFDTVYIATGNDFPDALSGSALAAKNNAPIILTEKNALYSEALSLINSKSVKHIIILGGTGVVSDAIKTQINPLPQGQENQIVYALNNYSPDSLYLLKSVAETSGKTIPNIILTYKMDGIFTYMDTAVHENCHSYIHSKPGYTLQVFLNSSTTYDVSFDIGSIFKTEDMAKNLPQNLRTFRWDTYVKPESGVTANEWGAYGLLDEFDAYYNGIKSVYETYPFLKELPYSDGNWFDYYNCIDQKAYYEFKFWMLGYLIYAQKNAPNTYNSIMNNSKFRASFKALYLNFTDLIESKIPARKNEMVNYLNSNGKKSNIDSEGYLWIGNCGTRGDEPMSSIKTEMTKSEYQTMLNNLLK